MFKMYNSVINSVKTKLNERESTSYYTTTGSNNFKTFKDMNGKIIAVYIINQNRIQWFGKMKRFVEEYGL